MQVLDRGEKIEVLVDKTDNLRSQVSFYDGSYIKRIKMVNPAKKAWM